jgi:hypothetical protein
MAVSDGHGSAPSFRSSTGSALAVKVALELAAELARAPVDEAPGLSLVKRGLEDEVPGHLVRQWRQSIEASLGEVPFTDEELALLEERAGQAALQAVLGDPFLAFGATLLLVVATPAYLAYLQLGDGDIVAVSAAGDCRRPLAPDELLFGDDTTSLCSPDAWRYVRVCFEASVSSPPRLVLAATDGLSKSFKDDEGFLRVAPDLMRVVIEQGLPALENKLEGWLEEITVAGSGDDITVGLMYGCEP